MHVLAVHAELQIGPAPTQMHTFPVPAWTPENHGEFKWTEWFKSFQGNKSLVHDPDYEVPLAAVAQWMHSPNGMPKSTMDSMDSFLEEVSQIKPTKEQIIFQGSPWGALYELATGTTLARGVTFNLTETDATRPWIELLRDGTFSHASLAVDPSK